MLSHRLSSRIGERRLLRLTLTGQMLGHVLLAVRPTAVPIFVLMAIVSLLHAIKWPLLETYVSAGLTPAQQTRAVGRFNITWSSGVLVTMVIAGPIITLWSRGLFLLAGALNLAAIALTGQS